MSTKKIVITGASGFLGRNLIDAVKTGNEFQVYALSSKGADLQAVNDSRNIEFCHKDAVFTDEGRRILMEAIVVNCAFPRNYNGREIADGLRYIRHLFSRSKECGVKAIINISSQSLYSQTREEAATEETPLSLENVYAVGKYATELMLESICDGTDIKFTNLRLASLIGPGFDQRIVNRFVKQALEGNSIKAVISGQRFGFLDIEDAVRAILLLLNIPVSRWRSVYNVGNGKGYTIEEILISIREVFQTGGIEMPDIVYEHGTGTGSTIVDYSNLNADTGFEPLISLHESVEKITKEIQRKIIH